MLLDTQLLSMKTLITFLTFISCLTFSAAQTSMSFYYVQALPQGAYQDNLQHRPNGIALEFMREIKNVKHLQAGAIINVAMYQNEDFEGQADINQFQRAYVETNEDDCYYIYQGVLRYFLNDTKSNITPYVQVQAGGTTFFSNLAVTEAPDDSLESSSRHYGTTWLAGLTAGTLVYINEAISAQLSLGYNFSGNVQYRSSPELDNLALYRVSLDDHLEKSKVEHVSAQLGIFMSF